MNVPKKRIEFLDWEFGVFFHFGIRTYFEGAKDWEEIEMPASLFNPTELDCNQWISTIKKAGAKYAVLVCKHHDGFALWPSKYTEYSVAASPWKDGKGDVVKEFCEACRKHDIKVGIYYSPAQFGYKNIAGKDYDNYFINQISELLTGYGKIDYLWFDGCGSEGHEYDTVRITKAIRDMQPDILIFNMWDPDTRWVGNETGLAGLNDCPEVDSLAFSVQTDKSDILESEMFLPAECDCKIRKHWFYQDGDKDTLKSLDALFGFYLGTVGHGANLLLNIGPDRRGLLMDEDVERLLELSDKIRTEFANPQKTFKDFAIDGDIITARYDDTVLKYLVIEEDLEEGSAVTDFDVEVYPAEFGAPKVVYRGYNIGHKLICPLNFVSSNGIRIVVKAKRKELKFKDIKLY